MAGGGSLRKDDGGESEHDSPKAARVEQGALDRIEALLRSIVEGLDATLHLSRGNKAQDSVDRTARCLDFLFTTYGHFNGKNVSKYLRDYESKMRVNLVDPNTALVSFINLVGESVSDIVGELLDSAGGDWAVFVSKMKREYRAEDADKLTRSAFDAWVMDRTKTQGPMELLREFEFKLKQLPMKDARLKEFMKGETFLETAGPRMRREINRALDLFSPGRDEDDTKWEDLVRAVKQVANCRRREEEEEEGQNQEMQRRKEVLVEEVQRLRAMLLIQGVTPPLVPSPTIERTDVRGPDFQAIPVFISTATASSSGSWCTREQVQTMLAREYDKPTGKEPGPKPTEGEAGGNQKQGNMQMTIPKKSDMGKEDVQADPTEWAVQLDQEANKTVAKVTPTQAHYQAFVGAADRWNSRGNSQEKTQGAGAAPVQINQVQRISPEPGESDCGSEPGESVESSGAALENVRVAAGEVCIAGSGGWTCSSS